jgi:hypothetical protein
MESICQLILNNSHLANFLPRRYFRSTKSDPFGILRVVSISHWKGVHLMSSYRPMVSSLIRVALPILVICGMASLASAAVADHLIITEFMSKTRTPYTTFGSPYIEVANPTASAIDLTDVYITDGIQSPTGLYYNITLADTEAANPGGGVGGDFHARFPDGYSLAAGTSVTIAIAGSTEYFSAYAQQPDFELYEDAGSPDSVPEMLEAFPEAINAGLGGGANTPVLSDVSESIVLYSWDGTDELVQDLDYVVWGTNTAVRVDKTGVTVGSSTYLPDTDINSQEPVGTASINFREGYRRADTDEGTEATSGGNGVGGHHDETSENMATTWNLVDFADDGHDVPAAPGFFHSTAPIVTNSEASPGEPYEGQAVTLSVTAVTEGTVSAVTFFVRFDGGAFQSNTGSDLGLGVWAVEIPAQDEGTVVSWYAELSNSVGGVAMSPAAAPRYLSSWTVGAAPAVGDYPIKLLLTEICTKGTPDEFIEIFNPSPVDVDMSDYYLGDSVYAPNDQGYWNIGSGAAIPNIGGGAYTDFQARFPDGFTLAAGDTIVVSVGGSGGFSSIFGFLPDLELFEDDAFPDNVPDMRPVFETANGNSIITTTGENASTPTLTNSSESVQLYYYVQGEDLAVDIDLFVWGTSDSVIFSKTGKTIGSSTYQPDTSVGSQDPYTAEADFGFSYQRVDVNEGNQASSGSNGVLGRDETSENLSTTFDLIEADPSRPSDGAGGGEGAVELLVEAKTFLPTMGELFPVRFVSMPRSETKVRVFDMEGRLVKTLFDSRAHGTPSVIPGAYTVAVWDGRNSVYERAKAGLYIIHMSVVNNRTGEEVTETVPVVVATRLSE